MTGPVSPVIQGDAAPMRRRLQARVARYLSFAVVVTLVATSVVLGVSRVMAVDRAAVESYRMVAQVLAPVVAVVTASSSPTRPGPVGEMVAAVPDLGRVQVVDRTGRVVAAWGEGAATPLSAAAVEATAGRQLEEIRAGRDIVLVVPLDDGGGRAMVATFHSRGVARELRATAVPVLVLLVIGLAGATWISGLLSRTITRGLETLRRGVRRIQEGNLDERVVLDSDDEIHELGEAFNAMTARLEDTFERLRAANRELEKLDQNKADMVANVSHELKTPLTALRGYLELLADGELGTLDQRAVGALEVCQRNVDRLGLRIEELFQLAQLEKRAFEELTMETVQIGRLVRSAAETLQPRFVEASLECSVEVEAAIPPVWASPEQIERVFLNLLDNAVKFTPAPGSVRVQVSAHDRHDRPGVVVRVEDTGVGIPAEELDRIFDRFHQVDPSARRRHGGMGLGLSLVRAIVEAHRGLVWAESRPGHGSVFTVWLPVRGPADEGNGPRGPAEERVVDSPPTGSDE